MKKPVIAVFDRKIGLYENPFVVRHTGEAEREWANLRTDQQNKYGKNPEDFEIYHLGYYDESKGSFENFDAPIQIGTK